jgi:hypothetical protein
MNEPWSPCLIPTCPCPAPCACFTQAESAAAAIRLTFYNRLLRATVASLAECDLPPLKKALAVRALEAN